MIPFINLGTKWTSEISFEHRLFYHQKKRSSTHEEPVRTLGRREKSPLLQRIESRFLSCESLYRLSYPGSLMHDTNVKVSKTHDIILPNLLQF